MTAVGADTKALRNRIKSVDSTLHLTKAMGLVASSKIRRASEKMMFAREYEEALENVVATLASCRECLKSPYMQPENGSDVVKVIVIAGDRGLAGGYNVNVFKTAGMFEGAEIIPIGKRACDKFSKSTVSSEHFSSDDAYSLAVTLCKDFKEKRFSKLFIVGTRYVSMMTQEAFSRQILPLSPPEKEKRADILALFEPDEETVLDTAVLEYVAGTIAGAVRESFACEVAARRNAMDSAGKNARQMISDLRLKYNRARQGAITQEITEIVAGSDA